VSELEIRRFRPCTKQWLTRSRQSRSLFPAEKLMTGVTVRPWTGIFMLRSTSSPETYFQAAFRVQKPMDNQES
jgi:hypothetical protein